MCPEDSMECEVQDPGPSGDLSPQPAHHPGVNGLPSPPLATSQPSAQQCQYQSPHVQQITAAEYREQSVHVSYTQQALRELKASPEYKKHTQRCQR